MSGGDLGWLSDVALKGEPDNGCLYVYDINDPITTMVNHLGIETVKEAIEMHEAHPSIVQALSKLQLTWAVCAAWRTVTDGYDRG